MIPAFEKAVLDTLDLLDHLVEHWPHRDPEAATQAGELRAALLEAFDEQKAEERRGGWIPVTERLPKRHERVIAREEFYGVIGTAFMHRDDGGWEYEGQHKDDCGVTHWRPMPEFVKETTK